MARTPKELNDLADKLVVTLRADNPKSFDAVVDWYKDTLDKLSKGRISPGKSALRRGALTLIVLLRAKRPEQSPRHDAAMVVAALAATFYEKRKPTKQGLPADILEQLFGAPGQDDDGGSGGGGGSDGGGIGFPEDPCAKAQRALERAIQRVDDAYEMLLECQAAYYYVLEHPSEIESGDYIEPCPMQLNEFVNAQEDYHQAFAERQIACGT